MAITGNLRTMQLSELLQWLSMGQKTGTLVVRGTAGEKRIYFQNGRIISSSSTLEREYLGHFLVAFGHITEEELTRAMEVQEESKILLGKILVMIGAINEDDLTHLIRLKASETIYDIFLWTEGAFEFIDGEIPKMPMVPISIDVTGIVMEGLRRYDEWARIRTKIRSLREIPAIVAPIDAEDLDERDRILVRTIDGQRSIDEIAQATHNPDFHVAKLVFDLVESGHAEIVAERAEEIAEPLDLSPEDPYETVFEDAASSPFDSQPFDDTLTAAEPEPPVKPAAKDFSRFLKRGPDSSTTSSESLGGRGAASAAPTPPPMPSPPPPAISNLPVPSPAAMPTQISMRAVAAPPPAPAPPPPDSAPPPARPQIPPGSVPVLMKPMEELMAWSFTPNEAFVISRINGYWDVRSIAKISPFPELEVLLVFQKLHTGGVIAWR